MSRLQAAFPDLRVDRERGVAEVDAQVAHMRRIAGPGQPFSIAEVDRKHRDRSRAVHVTLVEGNVTVTTLIEVDDGLLFSYASEAEERGGRVLVERVATVLGYDCEVV